MLGMLNFSHVRLLTTVEHLFYARPMSPTVRHRTADGLRGSTTCSSPVESALLDALVADLEELVVEGLEEALALRPDHRARVEADRASVRRARREAEWKARLAAEAEEAFRALFVPLTGSATAWATELGLVDPASLSLEGMTPDLLEQLREAQRSLATAEARRLALVAALVGVEPSPSCAAERQKAAEIAIATGTSHASAETLVHRARMLSGPFSLFGAALATGEVSFPHCLALLAQTSHITRDDVLAAIAEQALEPATRLVVSEFRRHVDVLVAELDPDVIARRETARGRRSVFTRRGVDGMSFLGLTHDTQVVDAVYAQLVEDGRAILDARRAQVQPAYDDSDPTQPRETSRAQDEGDLSPEACRADALAGRVLGGRDDDGTVTWDPAPQAVTLEVVVDLDTLRGLADRAALVGGEPVPGQVGRDLAAVARFFRRVVVDPVDGHLLDYGDQQYLPDPVRRFCFARDGGCREPGCTRRAVRFLELDHAEEFPRGSSSSSNCGALCRGSHARKTLGLFDITDSAADGSATVTSAWGQVVRIPPRPYLPRTGPPDGHPPPDEHPPF